MNGLMPKFGFRHWIEMGLIYKANNHLCVIA